MRILYGVFAQGQGHFSKAAVLVPALEARGHEVYVVSSGGPQPPAGYSFRRHRHFSGLAYEVSGGQPDFFRTLVSWTQQIPRISAHMLKLRSLVRQFQPDLILSDFEPLCASGFIEPACEVIALSRQAALLDSAVPLPGEVTFERHLARSIIRMFMGSADRLCGFHVEPASSVCVPPIIRPELHNARSENGEHIVIYNGLPAAAGGSPEELVGWAVRNRQLVVAYGMTPLARGRHGPVEFHLPDRGRMLDDLRTARAVMTTAGFTTPLEAFLLGKPICVVPIPGHWEQQVNAFHLRRAGLAHVGEGWDYDRLLELPPPAPDHPLNDWLRTPAERILDHILDEDSPAGDVSRPARLQGAA